MTRENQMGLIVNAVQELSLAKDLESVIQIVRTTARSLTGADGATFILREGDLCHYVDEDSISPLWKGQKFPMTACISGWSMIHRQSASIEDIYSDDRIPADAYRPTFVKSLAMVPIRTIDPIGAIGNYWAETHVPTPEELSLLQALADITAVSIENIKVNSELKTKLSERTKMLAQLTAQNKQLEDFCHIISHNLRAPLSNLLLIGDMIHESKTAEEKMQYFQKLKPVVDFLQGTFEELVDATQVRMDFSVEKDNIDLRECLLKAIGSMQAEIDALKIRIDHDFSEHAYIDYPKKYIDSIVLNLLSNSIKYRSPERNPEILFKTFLKDQWICLQVKDNGLGIDLNKYGDKLFKLRKTFHDHADAKGFGLFITKTQVEALGGKIWVDSEPGKGTTFTLQLMKK